jgi:hypothetical protein
MLPDSLLPMFSVAQKAGFIGSIGLIGLIGSVN